jgi:homopolymeric O-antigen transport system ATP-binding protein
MSDIAIRVENLSKKYEIRTGKYRHDTLRDQIAHSLGSLFQSNGHSNAGRQTFWALKGVSFKVTPGEVVGIIGKNGAGKSTLLKILSRITCPTAGSADIHGRIASLLEVGTGFHGELTGRENIYLNGAILGMKKAEIDRKFDEIVAFSEVDKFIDTPVKRYSSGMYVRLAFAVAAHLEPEILVIDEVLAVGDAAFQKKCLGKMGDVASLGRTVLFVSHNMSAVAQICSRILFLENGQIVLDGDPSSVISAYLTSGTIPRASWRNSDTEKPRDAEFQFISAGILSMDNEPAAVVDFNKGFQMEIGYQLFCPIRGLSIVYQVLNSRGEVIWSTWDTDPHGWRDYGTVRDCGRYVSRCRVPGGLLRPGRYALSIGACAPERRLVSHNNLLSFDVSSVGFQFNENRQGIITPMFEWTVTRVS